MNSNELGNFCIPKTSLFLWYQAISCDDANHYCTKENAPWIEDTNNIIVDVSS